MADSVLTTFIERTRADPALARDLLDATDWNLETAVAAYQGLYDTQAVEPPEYEYNPNDFESSLANIPEDTEDGASPVEDSAIESVTKSGMDDNEAQRRHLVKHQRQKRGRGLSFLAEEVVDKFNKVAVSTQRVRAKEQVTIDEQFFNHSFIYPDFSAESDGLQEYIAADLIEVSLKKALERLGRLNWWTRTGTLPSLEPLATSGDGNCLLHAASLYMWGFHDRELILRTALHRTLTTGVEKQGIQRRWKYHTQLRNDDIDLTFSADEWDFEWRDAVRIATNQPRQQRVTASLKRYSSIRLSYESLEEIHVFALAHVLRRAVIVISDCTVKNFSGEDLAPIYFGGIYLPFEVNPTSCYKSPIVLGYDSSHFAPLVAKDDKKIEEQRQRARFARVSGRKDTVVPLVTPDGSLLPVQFVYDPEKKLVQKKWATSEFTPGEFPDEIVRLLEAYLDVRWIQLKVESVMTSVERSRSMTENDTDQDYDHLLPIEVTKVRFPAAYIKQEPPPIYQKELIDKYLDNVRTRYEEQLAFKAKREEEKKKREENQPVPCATEGCGMFGKLATNNLCSVCYQAAQVTKNDVNEYITQSQENESQFIITKPSEDKSRQASTEYQWPVSDSPDSHRPIPKQVGPSLSKESTSRPLVNRTTPPPALPPRGQPSPSKSTYSKAVTETRGQPSPSKSTYSKAVTETIPKDTITSGEAKMNNRRRSPSPSSPAKTLPAPASPSKSTPSSKPDGSKQSWAKKLKIPTFKNASPLGPKKTTSGGGYSRDQIKPILVDSSGSINTAGGTARVQCKNTGCEFYGSKDKNGHCSKCYNELSKDSNV